MSTTPSNAIQLALVIQMPAQTAKQIEESHRAQVAKVAALPWGWRRDRHAASLLGSAP